MAAGCTAVIKPSEYTSASLLEFMKLVIEEADLPPGVVNVVTGYGQSAGEPLVARHPKVAKIAFTGGSLTGSRVASLAAGQTFKKVSLELGGKSPNIVFDDCIMDDAVNGAISGIFACDRTDLHRRLATAGAGEHPRRIRREAGRCQPRPPSSAIR